jgi:hypothetical protein
LNRNHQQTTYTQEVSNAKEITVDKGTSDQAFAGLCGMKSRVSVGHIESVLIGAFQA